MVSELVIVNPRKKSRRATSKTRKVNKMATRRRTTTKRKAPKRRRTTTKRRAPARRLVPSTARPRTPRPPPHSQDRWPTLAKCLKDERLAGVHFYLCGWGYCTPEEVALATAEPRAQVLDLEGFARLVTGAA